MNVKRPLCLFSAVFAALLFFLSLMPRPSYEQYVRDGEQIRISGILDSYEQKNGHLIYHLGRVVLLREKAVYPSGTDKLRDDVQGEDLRDEKGRRNRVLCYMNETGSCPSALVGKEIMLTGKAGNFAAAENEGQFDEQTYYRKKGYAFKMFSCRMLSAAGKGNAIKQILAVFRDKTADFYLRVMGEKEGTVLCAMILGMRGDMDKEIKSLYQASGIAHILAISGLHISLLGLTLYKILRRCGLTLLLSAFTGLSFVILYGIMVGGSSSVVRASVMLGLQILADLTNRTYDLLTAMALSGLLLLMGKSEYLTDAGFLLSFLAVLGIGIFSEPMTEMFCRRISSEKRRIRSVCAALAASLSVALTTTPVILWFYYSYPPYSMILNILLVPLMSVVLVSGIAGGIFRIAVFLWPARIVLQIYEKVCLMFQALPFHKILTGRPYLWQLVVYYLLLAVVVCLIPAGRASGESHSICVARVKDPAHTVRKPMDVRIIQFLTISTAAFILMLPRNAGMRVDMLSVGQGDCVLICDGRGHAVLSDAGSSDVTAVGEYRLLPYLKYNAIRHIDAVYLSHPHTDHYSAMEELFSMAKEEGISIGALYVSRLAVRTDSEFVTAYKKIEDSAVSNNIPIRVIDQSFSEGGEQVYGDIRIRMLYPSTEKAYDTYEDENDTSMVLYCRIRDFSILLTGDVTSAADETLLDAMQRNGITHADCLKVCHHGSRMANSEHMLTYLHPSVALISCGKENAYGHPHKEVLNRLARISCRYYVTAEVGQIRIKPLGQGKGVKCSVFCGSR